MTLILNCLWLFFGGFVAGCLWLFGGLILACTIVGLPWAFAAWRIAGFVFWPFGRRIVDREAWNGKPDVGTGCLGLGLNIIWFVFAGWYIALAHVLIAIPEAISIIGIPFAFKDLQLAQLALAPIGKQIVDAE
ncbi:YccF domain-containing protein [Asticcacaulis sp. EMRT-3]|uniref:YccF domain-containing protein n=1 Tax=Asticcacaulis sp. EMRT-3 TaxID=3040349 RepID=UPI0024AF9055|nr:YccF domain-containing protein [Asticcacaulis sp. EMRT-3]MDI7775261.1 YccF domain-containing protein [Asticcacaulis sp. EMRT-3]